MYRDRGTDGQGHRRIGTGTQTDRDREQGHRWIGTGTQADRGRDIDVQGQGHRQTGAGT
jgi:hypothetical protein